MEPTSKNIVRLDNGSLVVADPDRPGKPLEYKTCVPAIQMVARLRDKGIPCHTYRGMGRLFMIRLIRPDSL